MKTRRKWLVHRPMSVLLYTLSGMCAALAMVALMEGQFNIGAILYLCCFLGIGTGALIDSRYP